MLNMQGAGMQAAGALAGYGDLGEQKLQAQGGQPVTPTPGTLLRAMASVSTLNQRLAEMSSKIAEIAIAIGGPWPVEKPNQSVAPAQSSPPAMVALNDHIDAAHARVTDIGESIAAIRRALGA